MQWDSPLLQKQLYPTEEADLTKRVFNIFFKAVISSTAMLLCLMGCSMPISHSGEESAMSGSFSYINNSFGEPDISVSARSAVLMEANSGTLLWQKLPDARMPMASTTKIMTALVVLGMAELTDIVTVSPDAVGVEGSSIYLFAGERISVCDLLYALLLSSANDAAAALAIEFGGSIEGFADLMNKKADELGLKDTHFTNPHGLDDNDHYTTARELALIAREAMKNETFAQIVSTYKKPATLDGEEGGRLLVNHNKLLSRYQGALGIKTGFTKKSGRCLVSSAERDGVMLLCVTLSAPDDWRDHERLLDYGFSLCEKRLLCDDGEFEYVLPVSGGVSDYVTVKNAHRVELTLINTTAELRRVIELPPFVYAPVREGDIVGRLVYYIDGAEVASCPIAASCTVEQKTYKKGIFYWFD